MKREGIDEEDPKFIIRWGKTHWWVMSLWAADRFLDLVVAHLKDTVSNCCIAHDIYHTLTDRYKKLDPPFHYQNHKPACAGVDSGDNLFPKRVRDLAFCLKDLINYPASIRRRVATEKLERL